MDTLTHALSGVLVARALARRTGKRGQHGARLAAVALAGAFPDIDYAVILFDPVAFLHLHRGPTHSLVLLPLWAGLLAVPLARLLRLRWRETAAACALGLFVHVLGDWVTLYGTRLLYPVSDHAYALGISFDVNPWIAAVVAAGWAAGCIRRPCATAMFTLAGIVVLLAGQAVLRQQALALAASAARDQGWADDALRAFPQPLSPFQWGLLIGDAGGYRLAYLDLRGRRNGLPGTRETTWVERMAAAYRPRGDLVWRYYRRPEQDPLARDLWARPQLAGFRRFAEVPALLQSDRRHAGDCVWFTDLRHTLPELPAAFRYGFCRCGPGADWRPYRLRYLSDDERQAL